MSGACSKKTTKNHSPRVRGLQMAQTCKEQGINDKYVNISKSHCAKIRVNLPGCTDWGDLTFLLVSPGLGKIHTSSHPPESDCGDHPFIETWLFCPSLGSDPHLRACGKWENLQPARTGALTWKEQEWERNVKPEGDRIPLPSETLWQRNHVLTGVLIWMCPLTSDAEWLLLAPFPPLCPLNWKVCTNLCLLYKQLFLFLPLSLEGSCYILDTAIWWVHDVQLFYPGLWLVFHSLDSHVGTKKFLSLV